MFNETLDLQDWIGNYTLSISLGNCTEKAATGNKHRAKSRGQLRLSIGPLYSACHYQLTIESKSSFAIGAVCCTIAEYFNCGL